MAAIRFFCLTLMFCLASSWVHARPSGAQLADCVDEREVLTSLEAAIEDLNTRRAVFASIYNDDFPADLSLADALEAGSDGVLREWPEGLECNTLADQYQAALTEYERVRSRLIRQQQAWDEQPSALRDPLVRVWLSRERLLSFEDQLQDGLTAHGGPEAAAVQAALSGVLADLSSLRRGLFSLSQHLQADPEPERIAALLALWREANAFRPTAALPERATLDALPEELAEQVLLAFRLARLDTLVLRNAMNDIRGFLWDTAKPASEQVGSEATDGLLLDELRAFNTRLDWLITDTRTGYRHPGAEGAGTPAWIKVIEYLIGLGAAALLIWVARRTKAPAGSLQSRFARWSRGRRLAGPVSRVTASVPLLLPWLIGLLGLGLLHAFFAELRLPLLITLLPLARLYILYGLLCLAGEWLLQRTAQQAGSYLNDEQQGQVQRAARIASAVAVLPMLISDFIALGIGPSRLLDWGQVASVVGVLLAMGLLLRSRREDFVEALKSFLPSAGDRVVEQLLGQKTFMLVAPIAAPPLLLALLIGFMHKALFAYDWYRRLFARSFKLRVAAVEAEQEEVVSDAKALSSYAEWFTQSDPTSVPFIDSGLYAQLRKSLDPWLADSANDNALLLTGPDGAGKTTVLHRLCQDLASQQPELNQCLLRIEDKVTTAKGLLDMIGWALGTDLSEGPSALVRSDADRKQTLVVIDDAQNLFLRQVGGLAAWEALLGLVNARVENLFWLVLTSNHSWAYLGNVYGRDYQFRSIKVARRWSQSDVRSLVLSRNHLSGCRIRYDNILLATRGPEAGSIRNAEQLYFSLLWDACLGNPRLALQLWLKSIRMVGDTVVVGLPEEVSGAGLESLHSDLYFVYAAILIHDNMSSDELVVATALPERVVRRALKTGQDMGFIERANNRRYRVVALWYPLITRLLARKNLLHE
ncbi:ATP-binding protein [Halopseudomonas sp.]|uniref:ATP-binding protein n=1 Tax=Halopseudomonas sp. TaxID=2901191 RepID=UPI00311E78C5